ncbi:MAG: tetratricopeptide repeat protein [Phycisphaerales bacterium]
MSASRVPGGRATAFVLQAESLFTAGKLDDAERTLQRALQASPSDPNANNMMAVVMHAKGDMPRAAYFAERAMEADPRDPRYPANLGQFLMQSGKPDRARKVLEKAIAKHPTNAEIHNVLAMLLSLSSEFVASAKVSRAGLDHYPTHEGLASTHVSTMVEMGRIDEGLRVIRDAAEAHPESATLLGQWAHISQYDESITPSDLRGVHDRFGALCRQIRPGQPLPAAPARDPSRPLRVGFVSSDLRTHSVAFFIEPFLAGHDRAAFEIFCYATGPEDATTARLRSHANTWRSCVNMDDRTLTQIIRADRLDLAIELNGHTNSGILLALASRVAPVQATYLGYPGTTGVPAIDWRLVDAHTDPDRPEFDAQASERLMRMEGPFLCYSPIENAPDVAPPPCAASPDEPIRFGSFNAIAKVNARVVGLWARVLNAVPDSRLVLKSSSLIDAALRDEVSERLTRYGFDPSRLDIISPTLGVRDHLAQYAKVDIALDTFPYHGTTTTCEAIHMGVPVVTLAGDRHASRVGVSLLNALDLDEMVASNDDEFITIASRLARDRIALGTLRATLRDRLAASSLCDRDGFCLRFEDVLRRMARGATL